MLLSILLPLHLLPPLWIKAGQGASHHRARCQTECVDVHGCQSSTGSQENGEVRCGEMSRHRPGYSHTALSWICITEECHAACEMCASVCACVDVFTCFISVTVLDSRSGALTYFPQLQFWQVLCLLCAFLMIQLAQ